MSWLSSSTLQEARLVNHGQFSGRHLPPYGSRSPHRRRRGGDDRPVGKDAVGLALLRQESPVSIGGGSGWTRVPPDSAQKVGCAGRGRCEGTHRTAKETPRARRNSRRAAERVAKN